MWVSLRSLPSGRGRVELSLIFQSFASLSHNESGGRHVPEAIWPPTALRQVSSCPGVAKCVKLTS